MSFNNEFGATGSSPVKLPLAELCDILDVDYPKDDNITNVLWNVMFEEKVVVTEELLDWCGYTGKYVDKKSSFEKLLSTIPNICIEQVEDPTDGSRHCVAIKLVDFEKVMTRVDSSILRTTYSTVKDIFVKYILYKNMQLKEELQRTVEEKKNLRSALQRVVNCLRDDIAPNLSPAPICTSKERCLGLIQVVEGCEWYIVRRQRQDFDSALDQVLKKSPSAKLVHTWQCVPHAVDVANELKQRLRDLGWSAYGNILRVNDEQEPSCYSDDFVIEKIDDILSNNSAFVLLRETEKIMERSISPNPALYSWDEAASTTVVKHENICSDQNILNLKKEDSTK